MFFNLEVFSSGAQTKYQYHLFISGKSTVSLSSSTEKFYNLVWVHLVCEFSYQQENALSIFIGPFIATHAQTQKLACLDGEPVWLRIRNISDAICAIDFLCRAFFLQKQINMNETIKLSGGYLVFVYLMKENTNWLDRKKTKA